MKLTLNGIRQIQERYQTGDDVTAIGIDALVEKIGAQLGGVEEVVSLGEKYQGIVIAKVVSCDKHPDADKLSLCLIDDGGVVKDVERNKDGLVQVVCGAPNVREGLTVAWLPPGATVPETVGKEPFVLEARELRGQVSNGMLASPKELALGDSHAGILEIDGNHQPGANFAKTFRLSDEVVIDIENKMFTHRPDCFGWLGLARELAGIQGLRFTSPDWYVPSPEFPAPEAEELPLTVKNELPELVPRFTAVTMRDVPVGPSPVWLQVALAKIGQKSINNIVDLTNFYMLLTGQPLHAYDYDKVKALSGGEATIVVRNPKPDEKILLLNGKEIEPRAEAIMIATDKQLIGVGGAMGGTETEVDNDTKNIILECANFDMYSIRRTSMAHGLFTDAVTRFTKGQSPLQNLTVLAQIVKDIQRLGGKVAGPVIDNNHLGQAVQERQSLHLPVKLAVDFINARLGLQLSAEQIKQLLTNVEFIVTVEGDQLAVVAPFWRTDIELREDVVEEVGRLYGYDRLPLELPERVIEPTRQDPLLTLKGDIRRCLAKAGANEVLTYSFVHGDLLDKLDQDKAKAFQVANALSPDLQYYRLSLTSSLLDKVHANLKAGYDQFALFEIGKSHNSTYLDDDGVPNDVEKIGLVYAANSKARSAGAAYYQAKAYLEALARNFGLQLRYEPVKQELAYETAKPFDPRRSADVVDAVSGKVIGIIGECKPSVRKALKLPEACAAFEIATTHLQPAGPVITYRPLPRFPKVTQDISLKVAPEQSYQQVFDLVAAEVDKAKPDNTLAALTPVDIYQKDAKHITLRLSLASYERTLTDQEVNTLLEVAAAAAGVALGAERL